MKVPCSLKAVRRSMPGSPAGCHTQLGWPPAPTSPKDRTRCTSVALSPAASQRRNAPRQTQTKTSTTPAVGRVPPGATLAFFSLFLLLFYRRRGRKREKIKEGPRRGSIRPLRSVGIVPLERVLLQIFAKDRPREGGLCSFETVFFALRQLVLSTSGVYRERERGNYVLPPPPPLFIS